MSIVDLAVIVALVMLAGVVVLIYAMEGLDEHGNPSKELRTSSMYDKIGRFITKHPKLMTTFSVLIILTVAILSILGLVDDINRGY